MHKINTSFAKEAFHSVSRSVVNVDFILLFQMMFHTGNTLTAVALSAGFTILPNSELYVRPGVVCCIILLLYIDGGTATQGALLHPTLAFPINFRFLVLLSALISEPMEMEANISFLLCLVFSQSTYILWTRFPACLVYVGFGTLLICGYIVLNWKREGAGRNDCTLREQFQRSRVHRSYTLRMSLRISLAMLITSILQLSKPLWISIVVISLIQLEFSEILEGIRHRFISTLADIILFFVFSQLLIPQQHAMLVIMPLDYAGSFLSEYKYEQVISAISALNVSLVILDTKTTIENRLFYLVLDVAIMIMIYILADIARKV